MIRFKPNKKGWLVIGGMLVLVGAMVYAKRKRLKKLTMDTVNWIKEKTWDFHSDRRIATLHPSIRAKAKEFIIRAEQELGIKLRVTSALRTFEEQEQLYAQGRTKPGKVVTNARAGRSLHNYGLALDVVEIKDGEALWHNPNWNKIADLGKSIGFSWGGDWTSIKDRPHFEMRFGKTTNELIALYQSGEREGEYVNLV